jgi:hypothetical protein
VSRCTTITSAAICSGGGLLDTTAIRNLASSCRWCRRGARSANATPTPSAASTAPVRFPRFPRCRRSRTVPNVADAAEIADALAPNAERRGPKASPFPTEWTAHHRVADGTRFGMMRSGGWCEFTRRSSQAGLVANHLQGPGRTFTQRVDHLLSLVRSSNHATTLHATDFFSTPVTRRFLARAMDSGGLRRGRPTPARRPR